MPKHFGPQNIKNGYAAMGGRGTLRRPIYAGVNSQRSVADAIAEARRHAAAEARRKVKK
jgi:hypothetical protein